MKNRIAYNLTTGEFIESRTSKKNFARLIKKTEESNRSWYGIKGRWVFRNPWG